MPKLIDKEELIFEYYRNPTYANLCKVINDAPTVDAEPVVRCKDCKHWERDTFFQDGWCRGKRQGDPNWFCADGKRREE